MISFKQRSQVWAINIWTSLRTEHRYAHTLLGTIFIGYYTVNFIITFLLYIQLFKENDTFKLHFVLIALPCKQQNVKYNRFLNYMLLPLKRTSSYKTHTQLINILNNKNFETKRTYNPQLRTIADECTLHFIVLRHFYVHVLLKMGFIPRGKQSGL